MNFVGIDPGLTGGIALYYPFNVKESFVWPMPIAKKGFVDASKLYDIVCECEPASFCIELVHSRPRQAGVFNFGLNTGIIHGVLGALNIPFQTIAPQKWKPAMGLQRGPEEDYRSNKDRARRLAIQLFPHLAKDLSLKKDDGKAEALLLAVYFANASANQHGKEKK